MHLPPKKPHGIVNISAPHMKPPKFLWRSKEPDAALNEAKGSIHNFDITIKAPPAARAAAHIMKRMIYI